MQSHGFDQTVACLLQKIFDQPASITPDGEVVTMLLSVNNLSKAYGDRQVLTQVSLTLAAGQKVGLVGANGVGKSTLLKIIVGEVPADSGSWQIVSGADVAYLPQVLAVSDELTMAVFRDQTLGNLHLLEARLWTLETLSGGEKSRVGLAGKSLSGRCSTSLARWWRSRTTGALSNDSPRKSGK